MLNTEESRRGAMTEEEKAAHRASYEESEA